MKIEQLECVKDIEGECGVRTINRCRKPRQSKKLDAWMHCSRTCTKSKSNHVDATDIHNGKIFDWRSSVRTSVARMTEVNFKSEFL